MQKIDLKKDIFGENQLADDNLLFLLEKAPSWLFNMVSDSLNTYNLFKNNMNNMLEI